MREGPLASGDQRRRIAHRGQRRAGDGRVQHQLVEGGLIAEALLERDHRLGTGIVEDRGAGAGQLLAEAGPVVADLHALLIRRHQRDHRRAIVRARGIDVDPVGIDRAGGIVFPPIHPEAAALRRDLGDRVAQLDLAHLGPAVAGDLARGETAQPGLALGAGCDQPVLDQREMAAQPLGQVGVGLGQVDQQVEELLQAGPGAAEFHRDAQRGEARLLQPADLLMGQAAVDLAPDRAFGDAVEDGAESRLQFGGVGRAAPLVLDCHGVTLLIARHVSAWRQV